MVSFCRRFFTFTEAGPTSMSCGLRPYLRVRTRQTGLADMPVRLQSALVHLWCPVWSTVLISVHPSTASCLNVGFRQAPAFLHPDPLCPSLTFKCSSSTPRRLLHSFACSVERAMEVCTVLWSIPVDRHSCVLASGLYFEGIHSPDCCAGGRCSNT